MSWEGAGAVMFKRSEDVEPVRIDPVSVFLTKTDDGWKGTIRGPFKRADLEPNDKDSPLELELENGQTARCHATGWSQKGPDQECAIAGHGPAPFD